MDRRRLIVRRFGALTFGIGYYEGGVWVDHTARAAGLAEVQAFTPDLEAIHRALGCCAEAELPIPLPVPIGGVAAGAEVRAAR